MAAFATGAARAQSDSRAVADFDKLVQANLQEAQTLHDELPAVSVDPTAKRVWKRMITEHLDGARIVAREDRKLGGSPDLTKPMGNPASGSLHQIISETLRSHLRTLRTVEGMKEGASPRELETLLKVEKVVRSHIIALRDLGGHARQYGHYRRRHRRGY